MTNLFSKISSNLNKLANVFIPNHFLNKKKKNVRFPWTFWAKSIKFLSVMLNEWNVQVKYIEHKVTNIVHQIFKEKAY